MEESVGNIFAGFELEACIFSASESVLRITWLGFVSGEFTRLAEEVCDTWEKLQVQKERHFCGEGGKKGA